MSFETYKYELKPLEDKGLYDAFFEHDSCGVGLVADITGKKSHDIVLKGLEVIDNLKHRGAVGADNLTGDGAGLLISIPHDFFTSKMAEKKITLPDLGCYGVGVVFLPSDKTDQKNCEQIVSQVVTKTGQDFLGWREVPVDSKVIGTLSNQIRPTIKQFFVGKNLNNKNSSDFENYLYLIRKKIENTIIDRKIENFYISSLSSKTVVYKGLLKSDQLLNFYQDFSDPFFKSSFAMVHSRFSTNTLGSWRLAHPYRYVMHNGEINTLRGNINWMNARESSLLSSEFSDYIDELKPITMSDQSDTAIFDNVLELLIRSGRSLPHSLMMMLPEAWGKQQKISNSKRDFYEFHSSLMEPWDGPSLIVGTDGDFVCAISDRNGLRPCRYYVTKNNLLVMGSETGILKINEEEILYKSRIEPGKLFTLDINRGLILSDEEIKEDLFKKQPYGSWLKENVLEINDFRNEEILNSDIAFDLSKKQIAFGFSKEELRMIVEPMVLHGYEAVGSMGNDSSLAVLSDQSPRLFNYFKQLFAQVSNPPLDAIREDLVTSTERFLGPQLNLLEESPDHCKQIKLRDTILTNNQLETILNLDNKKGIKATRIPILFNKQSQNLKSGLDLVFKNVEKALNAGFNIIVLSDKEISKEEVAIPSLLATSAVHHHLIRNGLRTKVSIIVESGEPRDISHFSLLFSYGASGVNPWLIFETIKKISLENKDISFKKGVENFIESVNQGVVKVMSKMGISTLQSYIGAQVFEAVGLSQSFIDSYFVATPSRIQGIGIEGIEKETLYWHDLAYDLSENMTEFDIYDGGKYQWRVDGEHHMWNPDTISALQKASRNNDKEEFKKFSDLSDSNSKKLCTIRGLLEFKKSDIPISLENVESAEDIVKRFATGAISLGSVSKEAHETLAIAMNRIGARSNTGEGGEDPVRFISNSNGDSKNSAIKQVASGRFGVSIDYLSSASDLQIKMAQGSKPGEGGQIPGHKVDGYIAEVRNATPGVELISPPPHHDIYSIEDLAQLIYDLKNSNPESRIHVKLVSEMGVGIIASGVSKARADVVLISGDSGGTGASPESSIQHAGLPWELGLAEAQQVLVANDLRGRIVLQTDGQLKTARDVAIACLLGAEEFGLATAPLVVMGCIMLRKCHLNTCSVGIATQDPELRKRFTGTPEDVINYFYLIAEQLRSIMADLGFRTIDEMVGRSDKLDINQAIDHWKVKGIDVSKILYSPDVPDGVAKHNIIQQDHQLEKAIDINMIDALTESINSGETKTSLDFPIGNHNRSVGTMLSNHLVKNIPGFSSDGREVLVNFSGSAGQSFGAFLSKGVTLRLTGDANDYLAKGLSGGKIILLPKTESVFTAQDNIITGNVALYGATGGEIYISGLAGERFAVRNSGATAVVDGIGDHGCEYMTKGLVIILGKIGKNFAAGMSGGIAYIFDEDGKFPDNCNQDMVNFYSMDQNSDSEELFNFISKHFEYTSSPKAKYILENRRFLLEKFVKVVPKQYGSI